MGSTSRRVRVQRTPNGQILGAGVAIPAKIIQKFAIDETEYLNIEIEATADRIILKVKNVEGATC